MRMLDTMRYAAGLLVLLFTIAGSTAAQSIGTSTVKKVDAYLERLEKIGYSGTALVAIDGKPVISRGYGFSDRENRIKNSPKTIHDIGSITKQFTAAAILKLEMQGKLSTDDKITKYFPDVPLDKAGITIHQLLRHSSGLPAGIGGDFDKITEADFIEKVLASPLRFPVGTQFGYSNIGYSLLALVVENVSGRTYESFMYENLWKPAGMGVTGYSRPKFDKRLIAVGYRIDERWGKATEKEWAGPAPYLHLTGNGGILSTTEDLLKWDQALLTDDILSKEAKKKYYFPALRPNETGKSHYGYGWDVSKTDRNTTRIWHNGSNRIFYADFYRFVDDGVTIILMTNNGQQSFTVAGSAIAKIIFDPSYEPEMPIPDNAANRMFTDALVQLVLTKNVAAAEKQFRARSQGVDLLENVVNAKGYDLLGEKKLKESIDVFKLNVLAFPKSANAYDSLGEAYLESGDKKAAAENYRKSLELDPENGNAREVLKKIEGK
jgi:CubicO group peptidase (beta-lactamase class C family)